MFELCHNWLVFNPNPVTQCHICWASRPMSILPFMLSFKTRDSCSLWFIKGSLAMHVMRCVKGGIAMHLVLSVKGKVLLYIVQATSRNQFGDWENWCHMEWQLTGFGQTDIGSGCDKVSEISGLCVQDFVSRRRGLRTWCPGLGVQKKNI